MVGCFEWMRPRVVDSFTLECMLNIYIVSKDGRVACMVESDHAEFTNRKLEELIKYAKTVGCNYFVDPSSISQYPRYIFTKNKYIKISDSRDIAKLLGIAYKENDWWDFTSSRMCYQIIAELNDGREFSLFGEISRDPKVSRQNVYEMTERWNKLDYPRMFLGPRFLVEEMELEPPIDEVI